MRKNSIKKKVLLISRKDAFNIENIVEFISRNFNATLLVEERENNFPRKYNNWKGDYIFSYLCPWILTKNLINNAKELAINFHPGPPSYPGSGCYNFALYHEAKEYGVTCHKLESKVDSGEIISVKKFPILNTDSVIDLAQRAYVYLNYLFYETIFEILKNKELKFSKLNWEKVPYKKKDIDDLCKLSRTMNNNEIEKRIRATTYPGKPGPYYID